MKCLLTLLRKAPTNSTKMRLVMILGWTTIQMHHASYLWPDVENLWYNKLYYHGQDATYSEVPKSLIKYPFPLLQDTPSWHSFLFCLLHREGSLELRNPYLELPIFLWSHLHPNSCLLLETTSAYDPSQAEAQPDEIDCPHRIVSGSQNNTQNSNRCFPQW